MGTDTERERERGERERERECVCMWKSLANKKRLERLREWKRKIEKYGPIQ